MTPEELRVRVAAGESESIEFKRTTAELQGGVQTVCAFLNGRGGTVLFGVRNDGRIVGQQVADSTLREVAGAINRIEPSASVRCETVPVSGDQVVIALRAEPSEDGPFTFDGRPYERIGTTTRRMPQREYDRRLLARLHSTQRWENRPADGYRLQWLDSDEVRRTLQAAVESGRLDSTVTNPTEALDRLGLRSNGRLLRAAVVAFGRRFLPDYPQCGLRLARFRGTNKTEFLDQRQLDGHAFHLLREADAFLRRHLPVAGRIEPGLFEREDQPIFPPLALREALVNALCHRDYSVPGGAVNVAVFDDRLEIGSTGLLPAGITVEDLKREHASRPRNPLIAEVFFRRGLIERWGRGTQKIVELCRAAGHPDPEFEERAGEVVVRFLPSAYHPPRRVEHDLTDRQREFLQVMADGEWMRFRSIYEGLGDPPSERTVRNELVLLRTLRLIESAGQGRGAAWRLLRPE